MSDVPNIQQQPVAGSAPARVAPRAQAAGSHADPLAFRALIERLRDQARALEKSAEQPLGAHELPGAVQAAHASLSDALSIADELVEAYRSSA